MELILKKDVQDLGLKDDVVSVKNGYGRNYLIPQGLATLATPSAKKILAENLRQRAHKEKKHIEEAKAKAAALQQLQIRIVAKTGGDDRLFGSVSQIDLAEALQKAGHSIDRKLITLKGGTIKKTGSYNAQIRLHREVSIAFDFEVVAETK